MRAGRLRHRLTLQSKVYTANSYGEQVVTWADEATVWGAIEPLSGREYFAQQEIQAEAKVRITIRYYSGVDETWRVKHGSTYYNIVDALKHNEIKRTITLMCREGVSDDQADAGASYLLLESGDQLLLESSGSLILE